MKKILCLTLSLLFSLFIFAQKARINHTAIFVQNLSASKNFYQNIIGLDTVANPFNDGKHVWMKTGATTTLHLIEGAKEKKEYFLNNHTCFSISSVNDFITVLKKNDIWWQNSQGERYQITTRPDGVHQIWLQDPDGYWIEINDDKF